MAYLIFFLFINIQNTYMNMNVRGASYELIVDEIFAVSIHSPIGPTNLLRRFLKHHELFTSQGVAHSIFTLDFASCDAHDAVDLPSSSVMQSQGSPGRFCRLSKGAKLAFRRMAKRSVMLTDFYLRYVRRHSLRTVKKYLSYARTPDVLVFTMADDLGVYLELVPPPYPKIILFHHNDGSTWDMEEVNFPKLRKTSIFKKLDAAFERAIRTADANVFIASAGREHFHELHPDIPREKLYFFHNGVDDLPYTPSIPDQHKAPFRLISAGTITPRKGQHLVIEALGRLSAEQRERFTFSVIGDGSGRAACEAMVNKYNLQDQVQFLGSLPNEQVAQQLNQASIYILMSNNEGLPLSIIEGMRAGLPVISTHVAGIPELVETGRNGVLLSPSADELYSLFCAMDQYDWQKMGGVSRERFEQEFTLERMIDNYCTTLHTVAGK